MLRRREKRLLCCVGPVRVRLLALRKRLIQPVADLGEARIGARFVLVAARRPTDADGADRFVAGFDRHATQRRYHLSIVKRGIERAWRGDLLGQVCGRDAPLG